MSLLAELAPVVSGFLIGGGGIAAGIVQARKKATTDYASVALDAFNKLTEDLQEERKQLIKEVSRLREEVRTLHEVLRVNNIIMPLFEIPEQREEA